MKRYTITTISRYTGRRHTWHTDKSPRDMKLMEKNWYVNVRCNVPISAHDLERAFAATTAALKADISSRSHTTKGER